MMDTEIFKIDTPWAEKLRKTRVSFLMAPTVMLGIKIMIEDDCLIWKRKGHHNIKMHCTFNIIP